MTPEASHQPICLLSAREVATILGLSVAAVYELCSAGAIPYRRIGVSAARGGRGRIKIDRADLDTYLASTKIEGPTTLPIEGSGRRGRATAGPFVGGCELLRAAGWKG